MFVFGDGIIFNFFPQGIIMPDLYSDVTESTGSILKEPPMINNVEEGVPPDSI